MNILVVEDRGSVSFYLTEALQAEGHVVLEAFNINDAKAHWDQRESTPIDCMIVDLNMPPDGLTQEQKGESQGGLLTGWLWLRDYVLPRVSTEYRRRVIMCSHYLADLRNLVRAGEYQGIFLVEKRGLSGGSGDLLERVRAISRLAE
jgi:hypothetical protein